jgi:cytoskeletal protein CcmA (bactofilin family)
MSELPDEKPQIIYPGWYQQKDEGGDLTETEANALYMSKITPISAGVMQLSNGVDVTLGNYSTGNLQVQGGVSINKKLQINDEIHADKVTDVVIGTLNSGSIISNGGLSIDKNIQSVNGRIYCGAGSSALPGFAFVQQSNLGMYRLSANTIALAANNNIISTHGLSQTSIYNRTVLNGSVLNSANSVSIVANDASQSTAVLCINSTSNGVMRNVMQTTGASSYPYEVYDNGSFGYTHGMLANGIYAIAGSSFPLSGKQAALTCDQANIVSIPLNLRLNNVLMHNQNFFNMLPIDVDTILDWELEYLFLQVFCTFQNIRLTVAILPKIYLFPLF